MSILEISSNDLSQTAVEAVALKFNPSGIDQIDKIKFLAAALITAIEECGPGRAAAVAITHVETGSMWGVKAVIHKSQQ